MLCLLVSLSYGLCDIWHEDIGVIYTRREEEAK